MQQRSWLLLFCLLSIAACSDPVGPDDVSFWLDRDSYSVGDEARVFMANSSTRTIELRGGERHGICDVVLLERRVDDDWMGDGLVCSGLMADLYYTELAPGARISLPMPIDDSAFVPGFDYRLTTVIREDSDAPIVHIASTPFRVEE